MKPCAWPECTTPAEFRVTVWPAGDATADALDEFAACKRHADEYARPWRKP